ncbi:MAG TPA: GNAT family N-acetyltransferase [Hyphomicrobiaceae bacterium]|jgi:phosphinothricin acetyltransferase|nr:GNAT family N-acetyltransferase [Hyphomicrobiaceae bacterium]
MTKPTLRPAAVTDIPAISAIYREAVLHGTASFELDPPTEQEMLQRYRTIVDAGYPYFVGELDGAVVGYAYAGAYRTRPAYRFTVENSVYIAPEAQGKGVGRALLQALIEACTARHYRLMIAVIGDSGHQASIGLHRRLGFRFCGTLHSVGYKFGRWLDSVIMELPLAEGDTTPPREEPPSSARR